MIRCRIRWATKWCVLFFGNSLLSQIFGQNTEKTWNRVGQKNSVFPLFRYYLMIENKCHICSFVEQVKLYRLVYHSIWTMKKFKQKKFQIWICYDTKNRTNMVSDVNVRVISSRMLNVVKQCLIYDSMQN
jgi:hypothetical protein